MSCEVLSFAQETSELFRNY